MGNSTGYSVEDFVEAVIDFGKSPGSIQFGNAFYAKLGDLFCPLPYYPSYFKKDVRLAEAESSFLWGFYQQAPLLRRTILDEDIPLEEPGYGCFDGCRRSNAIVLGYIRYHPALPELREAMIHDNDIGMRTECVYSIGQMHEYALPYVGDICKAIIANEDVYFRGEATSALGKLADKSIAPLLKELYGDTLAKMREHKDEEDFFKTCAGLLQLSSTILRVLLKIDKDAARKSVAEALKEENPYLDRFIRRELICSRCVSPS